MNLIGKILIGLIIIMSVVFMCLAMAVYSTHQNWYSQAQNLNTLLNEERVLRNQQVDRYNRMESRLTGDLEALQQQIRKLESERATLTNDNSGLQAELDQLRQEAGDRNAAVAATQQNNNRLMAEVTEQRSAVRENQQARDRNFGDMLRATEARDQTRVELAIRQQQVADLTQQVARMEKLLRANGVDPKTDPDFVMEPTDGMVARVHRRGATQLIEVTIGADDGLRAGDTVEVFRGTKYLGRAEIIRTEPDRAVGKLDRRFLQGTIQEGDRVATRLKLS